MPNDACLPTTATTRPPSEPVAAITVDAQRLAVLLGVGLRTVRTWDAAGKLPQPVRIGKRTLWYLPEVHQWMQAGAPDRATWEVIRNTGRK
jgi:prophage regulatory protein